MQRELSFGRGADFRRKIFGNPRSEEHVMNSQPISVILAMPHYWLIGSMPRSGVRLQDLLGRTNTDFISISDAQIFSDEAATSPLAELNEVLVPKKQILCVSTSGEEHEA